MIYRHFRILAVLALAAVLTSCSDNDNDPVSPGAGYDFSPIISNYVDNTILATYSDLAEEAGALQTAVETLAANPVQANVDAAAAQWINTREPWEASEGFLFGPVAFLGLDPSLDSWPLDKSQLDAVLASEFELSPDFIRDGLNASLRGFHTIEYLLFRDGAPRDVTTITERERAYLVAATTVLAEDATLLYSAWMDGYEGGGSQPFATEFKLAGKSGSRYTSQHQAIQEMLEGMIGIADEVGNGKISDPFTNQDPAIVESWYSWNSLTDFQNNIKSIQNVYLGGYHNGTRGTGLTAYVQQIDSELDARVQNEIQAAIDAIQAIPHPFRNNLTAASQINAAITACNTLMTTLEADVKPLIAN